AMATCALKAALNFLLLFFITLVNLTFYFQLNQWSKNWGVLQYHSAFLDSEGEFTYAQWLCTKEIENRLEPLKVRTEKYRFIIPDQIEEFVYLQAKLNYRRMPDSLADNLKIERRPVIQVAKEIRKLTVN
ncbi:MAG: hypothetical protein GX126_08065, partial [Bacteroidales bacterium]|nr:hypothetical protein [Bacteroidales bacterium]